MEAPRRRTEFSLASPEKDTGSATSDTSAEVTPPTSAAPIPDSEMSFPKKAIANRTQSLQSVLSAASLKSLTQMTPAAAPGTQQRTLHRNPSTISNSSRTASRDFQSFIQAPVLTSVQTLRQYEAEIGQHSPFGDAISADNNGTTTLDYSASQRESRSVAPPPPATETAPPDLPRQLFSQPATTNTEPPSAASATTETSVQQQPSASAPTTNEPAASAAPKTRPRQPSDDTQIAENLTINALKKLSMSPLPMVSHGGGVKRVSSTPSTANTAPPAAPPPQNNATSMPASRTTTPAPYQPATVDLSSFPSLTRQSSSCRSETPTKAAEPVEAAAATLATATAPESVATPRSQTTISSVLSQQQSRFPATATPSVPSGVSRQPSVVSTLPRRDYHAQQAHNLNKQMKPLLSSAPVPQTNGHKPSAAPSARAGATNYFSQGPQGTPQQRSVSVPLRQLQSINGLRSPMYVPAVLRVTQNTMIPTPDGDDTLLAHHPSSSPESVVSSKPTTPLPGVTPQTRSYDDIMRAPPTRKHWLKDESVDKCMIEDCPRVFNFFERRHHCRKCGGIFCKEHTSHLLYINHLAQFTTGGRGTLSKVCDHCIDEYSQFISAEFGPASAPTATPNTTAATTPRRRQPLPTTPEEHGDVGPLSSAMHRPVINGKSISTKEAATAAGCGHFDDQAPRDQLVGSVPANWSWSSF